ncbi:uncharacterized protein LOC129723000 isoform X2 [Wyeomyia smithii]|uniref:uncharacterized protein LOC129723000 isoform X2 n=1 Tax=Wyeomyia smithii TaxID=174621 RepID=UPI002467F883|nr:uncharacterized protein LOC129723000 isoform X2 [Wyeomyia smithii]
MLYANNSTSILMCGMDSVGKPQCNIEATNSARKSAMDCEVEPEKGDLSPENSKKSDSSPLDTDETGCPTVAQECLDRKKMLQDNCCLTSRTGEGSVNKSVSMHEIKRNERSASEDLEVRNALAFTIDFGDGRKSVDTQRHEKMLERFQNRHKRGVSLSKLEGDSVTAAGKMKTPQSVNLPRRNKFTTSDNSNTEVKLRDKSKAMKESAGKRHSWSPRTSMTENAVRDPTRQMRNAGKFLPKSAALQTAFEQQNAMKDSCSSSEFNAESLDSSIGLHCIGPPLENFKTEDNDDSVSEAGTYTLDGDNYTEEQKERMNIDRMPTVSQESNVLFTSGPSIVNPPKRPTCFQEELEVIDLERPSSGKMNERRKNNILEVAFFHEPTCAPPVKSKQSYLEKIKSRMKNITHRSKSPDKNIQTQHMNSPDQGTFTSVTTSGILSIKPTLQNQPLVLRRNSLTKSHIDSSEYVQGVAKLNIHKTKEDKILNCYTDSEKANVLSDYNAHQDSTRHQTNSDASAISSVVSKKDWIQEWAKNAREYSKKPTPNCSNVNVDTQMTRSFNCDNRNQFGYDFDIDMTKSDYYDAKKYDEFGDNLDRQHLHRKQLERLLNHTSSSSSDPSLKQACGAEVGYNEFTRRGSIRQYTAPNTAKPPMSPSKIPSPIGSVGRARSVSRNRSLQGSNSDLSTNETEMYLQKTAAAISTLQNLHRRNSMRGSSVQNSSQSSPLSPASRRISPKMSPMNSLQSPVHNFYQDKHHIDSQVYSPQHQQIRHLKHQQQQQNILNHKRNLSLDGSESYGNALSQVNFGNQMSNSFHTDNINAILDFKKQHTRHNSFEGMAALPPKPMKCFQTYDQPTTFYNTQANDNRNEMKYNVEDEDDDDDDDEQLIVVTTGFDNLSLATKNSNIPSVKQFSKTQPNRNPPMHAKATQSVATRASTNKPTPVQMSSPIKRSSSFSVKAMKPITPTMTPKVGLKSAGGGTKIQKSASSTSFKKIVANYNDDEDEFYINDDDDLELGPEYSSNSEFSDKDDEAAEANKEPITNTRYNKTFLMRMEQNKKIAAGVKHGVAACPNTPELPRRSLQVGAGARERASMPRDSSLNRMKQDMHVARKSASKEITSRESTPAAASSKQKVQPKYLDISKYKTPGGGNFLKKDESKSYLVKSEVKKSPSSATVALSRNEPNRVSTRSVKSATPKATAGKKDAQKNAKEQELEMWRRRASYDPMKAAMEGKKKQEEARRQAQQQVERLTQY